MSLSKDLISTSDDIFITKGEIKILQEEIKKNINKLDLLFSKEFNNETRYILINESRKIKNEIKGSLKKVLLLKKTLSSKIELLKKDLESKKKYLQDNFNIEDAISIFCVNCWDEFTFKSIKEGKINKVCNYHPGKIKYYSCKGCGNIEYFSCCSKCITCLKTCKKGNHLCEFFEQE